MIMFPPGFIKYFKMIMFPPGFIKLRWPGYFFHTPSQKLYSIKYGSLKPLKLYSKLWLTMNGATKCMGTFKHYKISNQGREIVVRLDYLKTLKESEKIQFIEFKEN